MYNSEIFQKILKKNPVIPVVAINHAQDAIPLCKTLSDNGIKIIEITLRTEAGFEAITNVLNSNVDICVGAGTVYNKEQFKKLEDEGVNFIVSPGTTDELLEYAADSFTPYLPGVMTSSEILKTRNIGFKFQKLFPASIAGGINALKAYSGVYADVKFCPTGGINSENFIDFLSQSNVCAIGGTWIASKEEIEKNYWALIGERAKVISEILKKERVKK